ncbi:hypothetical protein Pcinc_001733 [Petrolisthes cinctipes]|uniref:Uncharacterized protein n=1 Tax=Petrolisthes cinctipes TaxID=88211 RepID=A0AAE1GKZ6_PETCI|nr:hypothetical protein Pcinc_001733 [Petrolisthes cinctipes]
MVKIAMMLMLQPTTSTGTLVTDDCIVYQKLTFKTFSTSIPIHVAYSSRNSIPKIFVEYWSGNTDTINLNQLQFGKWTYGQLNLGTVSKFIPLDDDAYLGDDNNNNNVNDASMVWSQITLDGGFFYTYCAKATPNFVEDYKFYHQLPRTGHTEEEILLYPSVDAKHNITMHIGGEDWVVCKVNGEAVVRKVSEGPCAPVDEKLLKLRLAFPDDRKMEMELDGKNAVTVSLTGDYESVFFKQLEPDVTASLVYVQCPGTCPDPDDTPGAESSNTALIVVSDFLAIFIVLSLLLMAYVGHNKSDELLKILSSIRSLGAATGPRAAQRRPLRYRVAVPTGTEELSVDQPNNPE